MKLQVIPTFVVIFFITSCNSGIPRDFKPQIQTKDVSEDLGLYDPSDKVISLYDDSIDKQVIGQNYATLLEFYNSFCGHCKRFAPEYKKLAENIYSWRDHIQVMAIDCANDANNDVCREYEVMSYPSLRYFSPHYEAGETKIGRQINSQDIKFIQKYLVTLAMNETRTDNSWPDFSNLTETNKENLFKNCTDDVQYTLIIYERDDSTLGGEMILEFSRVPTIRIRRTTLSEVAKAYSIETFNQIAFIDRNNNIITNSVSNPSAETFKNLIKKFLESKNLHETPDTNTKPEPIKPNKPSITDENQKILDEVKKRPQTIFQADLEQALRYSIFHEIPRLSEINGERLLALQRFVSVISRYNPLGDNGKKFLEDFRTFIIMHNQEIGGKSIHEKLGLLEKEYSPMFSSGRYIGCSGSKSGSRGFTCGLWQLFHYMTVQASLDDQATDPLEVLQAIHGYVKHFFGCTDCSSHFQAMAAQNKIWNTTNRDNAVLWLWSAHNEVNSRLAGDETEDPLFPKVQYPTAEMCPTCIRNNVGSSSPASSIGVNWDKAEVLEFLKRVYHPLNISHFGVDDETVLPGAMEKIRTKRMIIANVFSDIDMRMGILLYVFCIGMMCVAVKLFLRKGYRKKIYAHDFLGKV